LDNFGYIATEESVLRSVVNRQNRIMHLLLRLKG